MIPVVTERVGRGGCVQKTATLCVKYIVNAVARSQRMPNLHHLTLPRRHVYSFFPILLLNAYPSGAVDRREIDIVHDRFKILDVATIVVETFVTRAA